MCLKPFYIMRISYAKLSLYFTAVQYNAALAITKK